jgi:hypothetical protein
LTEAGCFVAAVPDMPETVAKFFAPEDSTSPWRWESVEDRCEREARTNFGGWCDG